MKTDEFAFFNQQLAAMLRDGLPLEGALHRLCEEMRRGNLRDELKSLEADLTRGTPLPNALAIRQLPELYKQMMLVGFKSGNLPGVLTLLADYYQRQHSLATRLKGLMVYPMIVLMAAFVLSIFVSVILGTMMPHVMALTENLFSSPKIIFAVWLSPLVLGFVVLAALIVISVPSVRRSLRWRLPAFREARLAQIASALSLMLKGGLSLDNALALVEQLETETMAQSELANWRRRLAAGHGKFSEMAHAGKAFPPLFVWTVSQAGEDLAGGFQRTAEIYQARANARSEMLLYSALPCSVLMLGAMIVVQIQPMLAVFVSFLKALGGPEGGSE